MKDITSNEMKFLLQLLKSPQEEYNARTLSKEIGLSHMGTLKIAKALQKEDLLVSKQMGKAIFYRLNFNNEYLTSYLQFILKREAEHSPPYIKRWLIELKKITKAQIILLFGSVLTKQDKANDIDVLFVTDNKNFPALKKEIEEINLLNNKKIHPLFQTKEDLKNNIKKQDKVILNALKGIVIKGGEDFVKFLK